VALALQCSQFPPLDAQACRIITRLKANALSAVVEEQALAKHKVARPRELAVGLRWDDRSDLTLGNGIDEWISVVGPYRQSR
jgi:hypothetical protein